MNQRSLTYHQDHGTKIQWPSSHWSARWWLPYRGLLQLFSDSNQPKFLRGTKLEAAVGALENVLQTQVAGEDNLALRQFGGSCDGENTQMVVRFRQHNEGRVRNSVKTVQANGETTLTSAVIEAIGDFNDTKRFSGPGINKRIVVITGGSDTCLRDDDPAMHIRNRLEPLSSEAGIKLNFRFIGIALKPEQREQLRKIAELTGGISEEQVEDQLFFVNSQAELEEALRNVIEVEPVLTNINTTTDIMNSVTDQINIIGGAINRREYEAAEKGLEAAKKEIDKTQPLLEDLGQRLSIQRFQEQFQKLYELVIANRDLQDKQLKLLETAIGQGKSGADEARDKTIQEFNEVTATFNSNIREIDAITEEIVSQLCEAHTPP
jgi:von Willebrand factor type A domain